VANAVIGQAWGICLNVTDGLARSCIRDCRRCRRASQVGQVAFRRLLLEQRAKIEIAVRGMRSGPEHKEFGPVGRVAQHGGG
jgi:hypothetical protein